MMTKMYSVMLISKLINKHKLNILSTTFMGLIYTWLCAYLQDITTHKLLSNRLFKTGIVIEFFYLFCSIKIMTVVIDQRIFIFICL